MLNIIHQNLRLHCFFFLPSSHLILSTGIFANFSSYLQKSHLVTLNLYFKHSKHWFFCLEPRKEKQSQLSELLWKAISLVGQKILKRLFILNVAALKGTYQQRCYYTLLPCGRWLLLVDRPGTLWRIPGQAGHVICQQTTSNIKT